MGFDSRDGVHAMNAALGWYTVVPGRSMMAAQLEEQGCWTSLWVFVGCEGNPCCVAGGVRWCGGVMVWGSRGVSCRDMPMCQQRTLQWHVIGLHWRVMLHQCSTASTSGCWYFVGDLQSGFWVVVRVWRNQSICYITSARSGWCRVVQLSWQGHQLPCSPVDHKHTRLLLPASEASKPTWF